MTEHQFKIGMYLPELGLPFDEALATAKQIGVEGVWFNTLGADGPSLRELDDAAVDRMAAQVAGHGLEIFLINVGSPFKQIHLTDLELDTMEDDPAFRQEMDDLVRSMEMAARLGIGAVNAFTFAWPGEYSAAKPTWPMRWLTRGGYIADAEMEKLVRAFSLALEQAEKYSVDLALSMMPWNYTNTTGNFRRLAEALNSRRLKVMWGPSDNMNSGEADVATAGFLNIHPYLHGLHIKDLRVKNGIQLDFEYCALGEGDVDYPTILRSLRERGSDAILSVATHFLPSSGSREEAMRINYENLKRLIDDI